MKTKFICDHVGQKGCEGCQHGFLHEWNSIELNPCDIKDNECWQGSSGELNDFVVNCVEVKNDPLE